MASTEAIAAAFKIESLSLRMWLDGKKPSSTREMANLLTILMQNQESSIVVDQERASSNDKRFTKLASMRDALHLLIRMVLSELPTDARILCIGIGTDSELIDLAQAFPQC